MGVVKPPWVSKDWFAQCPFNYCDHFGEKEILATVCKICKDELNRLKLYKKAGEDPYDIKNVFKDVAENLSHTMQLVQEEAERMGMDLDSIPDEEDDTPPAENYPIYNLMRKYSKQVEKIIKSLEFVPPNADIQLVEKAVDSLAHSQHYILAKTYRALSSRWEEAKSPLGDELDDAKTSAFLAYLAIERNARALLAVSKHKLLGNKEKYLKFALVSFEMAKMLQEEFFPDEKLLYKEFGCEEYDECFEGL